MTTNPSIPNTREANHCTHKIAMLKAALEFVDYGSPADVSIRAEIVAVQARLRKECERHAEAVKGPGPKVLTHSRFGSYYR